MRKIRAVLRLRFAQEQSQRTIGQNLGDSTGTVNAYLSRARRAELSWPLSEGLDDELLERLPYPPPPAEQRNGPMAAARRRYLP